MDGNKFTRRKFVQQSMLFAGVGALAACTPSQPPAPQAETPEKAAEVATEAPPTAQPAPPAEAVSMRYWHLWTTPEVIKDWQNSEVFKEMTKGATWELLDGVGFEKQLTAVAGGDAPDAISFFDYMHWFLKDLCLPVTDYVSSSNVVKLDDYLPNMVEPATVDGQLLGVAAVECYNRYGLNINSRQAGEAGLDMSKAPLTWDEMYEWHKALTVKDNAGNIKVVGYDPYGEMAGQYQSMVAWWPAVSVGIIYYDNNTHKYNFNDPKLVDFVEQMTKFYDLIGPDNMTAFRNSFGQWLVDITEEAISMTVNGYWMYGQTYQAKPEVAKSWKPFWPPVPEYRRGTKIAHPSPHYVSIVKGTKYPDHAFHILEYIYSDDGAGVCWNRMGWLPARKSFIKSVDATRYPNLEWWLTSINEATDFSQVPQDPLSEINRQKWVELREAVFRHTKTAQEAMDEMQAAATEEYGKQFGG